MTDRTRAIVYGCITLILGSFAAFPYFMTPQAHMNERAWQIGILQAVVFMLSGWCFAKAYYLPSDNGETLKGEKNG